MSAGEQFVTASLSTAHIDRAAFSCIVYRWDHKHGPDESLCSNENFIKQPKIPTRLRHHFADAVQMFAIGAIKNILHSE